MQDMENANCPTEKRNPDRRPVVEWVFGLISGCGVVALIGFLGWQAVYSASAPADLSVRVLDVHQGTQSSIVDFEVENRGDRAASSVTVQAQSPDRGVRYVEFDHVAPHSVQRGSFAVPAGVSEGDLVIEIGGHTVP